MRTPRASTVVPSRASEAKAVEWTRDRFDPLVAACPVLKALTKSGKGNTGNGLRHKTFPGGHLSIGSSHKPEDLAAKSIRYAIFDEIERFTLSSGKEGDPVELGWKRTQRYRLDRKSIISSTPTVRAGRIGAWFARGDQRRFLCPCADCGALSTWTIEHLKYDVARLDLAYLACPHCGHHIDERERLDAVEKGVWQATAEGEPGIVSFHASILVSSATDLKTIAKEYEAANLARDTFAQFVDGVDLPKFLADAAAKGLGVGFANRIFGRDMGGPATLINGAAVPDRVKRIEAEENKHPTDIAEAEMRDSYTGAKQRMSGAYEGLLDQAFLSQEQNLKRVYNVAADVMNGVASLPKGVVAWGTEMGAAWGAVKASSALSSIASFGSEIAKLAPGLEGAAAGLGKVAGALGLIGRFTPVGTALTAMQAMQIERDDIIPAIEKLGRIAAGEYWTPKNTEAFQDLSQQRDELQRQIAGHDARAFDPVAHDPALQGLRHQLGEALAQQPSALDTPEITRLRGDYDAARRADPNANDATLRGLFEQFDELTSRRAKLADAGVTAPAGLATEFHDLRTAIEDRQSANVQAQATATEGAFNRLVDALARQPAQANEAPQVQAIRTDIDQRERDVRANYVAPADPVREQMTDQLADLDNRMRSFVDKLAGTITVNTELLSGTKAGKVPLDFHTFAPPTRDFDIGGPLDRIDPRPNLGLSPATGFGTSPAAAVPVERAASPVSPTPVERPALQMLPAVPSILHVDTLDVRNHGPLNAPMTIGDGPRFGLYGPMIEPTRIEPVTARTEPVKVDPVRVDSNVKVEGTVSGSADIRSTVQVEISPSNYFMSVLRTAEHAAKVALAGSLGTTMGTSGGNGVAIPKVPTFHGPH